MGTDARLTHQRVLVVDGSESDALLLQRILQRAGLEVQYALSGQTAVQYCESWKPDLVLLDVSRPDFDGFEISDLIRTREIDERVPIIFITSHHDSDHVVRAFDRGAADYVMKPFIAREVSARVGVQLRLRQTERELSQRGAALAELSERVITMNAQLAITSRTDPATSLLNRRAWSEEAQHASERAARLGEPFSIIYFDIDAFKCLNDALGHLTGDRYLVEIGACLRAEARGADLPGRYAGDEFVILCPGTKLSGAQKLADRVCQAIESRRLPHPASCARVLTLTAGVAESRAEGWEAVLRRAEDALYQTRQRCGGSGQLDAAPAR